MRTLKIEKRRKKNRQTNVSFLDPDEIGTGPPPKLALANQMLLWKSEHSFKVYARTYITSNIKKN